MRIYKTDTAQQAADRTAAHPRHSCPDPSPSGVATPLRRLPHSRSTERRRSSGRSERRRLPADGEEPPRKPAATPASSSFSTKLPLYTRRATTTTTGLGTGEKSGGTAWIRRPPGSGEWWPVSFFAYCSPPPLPVPNQGPFGCMGIIPSRTAPGLERSVPREPNEALVLSSGRHLQISCSWLVLTIISIQYIQYPVDCISKFE